ncbi:DUF4293 family protein [Parabacteroides sp. 52]|uniref:DUF4293 domain-containing protein n=1 Tax=unclassified Parabacteroides TaxID=2649774 RepID=UPI0013D55C72|nr:MULTISPECIES: DUF4293 domain-containing protein [unclassified Parabacteroides]MDH6534901.1 cation transport ATPase [Parabacteroides sp. PM5-20]NDV55721.1 DUF4293 family protein [Parabacteroides sp. 52]
MLQRIQTVYLLFIVILFVGMLFTPLALLQSAETFYAFDVIGVNTMAAEAELVYPTWALFVLTAIISLLALCTIFLFKKRVLQMRLCIFNALLMIGFYGLFFFFYWRMKTEIPAISLQVKFALSFPLVSLILDYLAIRNIGADEALVRSLNRLR